MKIYVPDFCNCSLDWSLIFKSGNSVPESKNILIKWSQIYKAFLFQNWEHVPETETCVPSVPEIENIFPQKFCLRAPVGRASFQGIESIALIFWGNGHILIKDHIISKFWSNIIKKCNWTSMSLVGEGSSENLSWRKNLRKSRIWLQGSGDCHANLNRKVYFK